jgi:hypothetical protein
MSERSRIEIHAAEEPARNGLASADGVPAVPGRDQVLLLAQQIEELHRRLREASDTLRVERAQRRWAEEQLHRMREQLEHGCQAGSEELAEVTDTVLLLGSTIPVIARQRSTEEVFEDHLDLRQGSHDRVEEDIRRNFSDNVIVVTNFGTFEGKDGVRHTSGLLKVQLPSACYEYRKKLVRGKVAILEWTGRCGNTLVDDGSDTFVIENGLITVQTIYYTVKSNGTPPPG